MRLLIVEDEPGIANFIQDGLTEEGFSVDVALHGNTGLELALSTDYDLVLLDWLLPGKSGIEVLRQIRDNGRRYPVIFLTAKDAVEDAVFGLGTGANDYIRKPFQFDELLARIRVQLRERHIEGNTLHIGDIELQLDSHSVRQGDREISLTPKEFSLLTFLLRNKGRVCTRTRIIEHVWDMHFDSDTSVIDVYINYLRKKLDRGDGKTFIHTIRGVGYVIKEDA